MAQPIEVTHEWSAQQWDWPLQHNDGVVRVLDSSDRWEVGLDVAYFTPKEIEVGFGHLIELIWLSGESGGRPFEYPLQT